MDTLLKDIDLRLAYIVMLEGTEEAPLYEVLWDLRPRRFVADSEVLLAAQSALRLPGCEREKGTGPYAVETLELAGGSPTAGACGAPG